MAMTAEILRFNLAYVCVGWRQGGGVRGILLGLGVFSVLGWGICVVFGWRCAISMVGLCYVGSTVGSAVFASVSILKIAEWSLTPMWITDAC